jgi:hypothetical protein
VQCNRAAQLLACPLTERFEMGIVHNSAQAGGDRMQFSPAKERRLSRRSGKASPNGL